MKKRKWKFRIAGGAVTLLGIYLMAVGYGETITLTIATVVLIFGIAIWSMATPENYNSMTDMIAMISMEKPRKIEELPFLSVRRAVWCVEKAVCTRTGSVLDGTAGGKTGTPGIRWLHRPQLLGKTERNYDRRHRRQYGSYRRKHHVRQCVSDCLRCKISAAADRTRCDGGKRTGTRQGRRSFQSVLTKEREGNL